MLELLELWEDKELVLAFTPISTVQVGSKCVQVVVLSEPIVFSSPADVASFEAMRSIQIVVF